MSRTRLRLTRWFAAAVVAATVLAAPALALATTAPGASRAHRPFIGTRPYIPPVGTLTTAVSHVTTSTNWSGYAVQTAFPHGQTNSVSDVKATWVVPTALASSGEAYASNWVGIDGYSSNTVEQIGTEQDWTPGAGASYTAWYEMFPDASIPIGTMNISPGDVVTAEVDYLSGTSFRLSLKDVTTGESFAIVQPITGALRSSAEWIVEAPSDNVGVLPFTNQTPTLFSACSATVNGVTGPIGSALWRSDPMTLVSETGADLAVPSSLNAAGDGFTVSSPPVPDTTPPTTTSDARGAYDNAATIHLSAQDDAARSGVAATYYQLDGMPVQAGTTLSVSDYGRHTLAFWSVDNAGNIETHQTVVFMVNDTIAPATTSDAQLGYPSAATIHLIATDNAGGSGIAATRFILDGGVDTIGTLVTATSIGSHSLTFWSVDHAGNVEVSHVVTFTIGAFQLVYSAGQGGTIGGVMNQTVAPGGSGTAVTAVPDPGFHFVRWSDGLTTATRTDRGVGANVGVTAVFAANPRSATSASLSASASSQRLGRYVTLSSRLSGGAPSGTAVRYEVKRPGSSAWVLVATRAVASGGTSSVRYKTARHGYHYFRVRFLGTSALLPSTSTSRRVRVL